MNKGTIRCLIAGATSRFNEKGIDAPHITAETLLAHVLKLTKTQLYRAFEQSVSAKDIEHFKVLVARRLNREPLSYITREKGFWTLSLKVTPDVLIPRPDTECLVETALAAIPEKKDNGVALNILDLGTGSGAIILSLAKERPRHSFFATDRSFAALELARENERINHPGRVVNFFCGTWFDAITPGPRFDLIVSNPPYIRSIDIETLDPEIHLFEPRLALDGGDDGLSDIRHIINEAGSYLKPGGLLMLEIGDGQNADINEIINETRCYCQTSFHQDLSGKIRVVRMEHVGKGF